MIKLRDRVYFQGHAGTVVALRPKGMVDVRMDETGRVERRHPAELTPVRTNGVRRSASRAWLSAIMPASL